jgi:hypothetical protein
MSDILHCPFCGSARFPTITAWVDDPGFGYTICCDAAGWSDTKGCGASSGWGETPEEAIAIWNRRAALGGQPAGVTPSAPAGTNSEAHP